MIVHYSTFQFQSQSLYLPSMGQLAVQQWGAKRLYSGTDVLKPFYIKIPKLIPKL